MTAASPRSKASPTPAILFQPSPALDGLSPWEALRSALAERRHDIAGRLPRTRRHPVRSR